MSHGNKAVGYARLSKKNDESLSISSQEAAIQAYARARGLELAGVIADDGVSGTIPLDKRPGGARLAQSDAAHVIVLRLDRAFRSAVDALRVVREWNERGVALHVINFGGASVDTKTAVGMVFFTVLAGFAQFERDLISERTRAALRARRDAGRKWNHVPFGFKAGVGNKLVPDFPAQQWLVEMKRWRAEGVNLRDIASRLNGAGVPTAQKPLAKWHASTVRAVLRAV